MLNMDMIKYTYYLAGRRVGADHPGVDARDIAHEVFVRLLRTPPRQAEFWRNLIKYLINNVWREKYTTLTRCKKNILQDPQALADYARQEFELETLEM